MLHLLLLFEIAFVFISDIGYESCYCTAFDADKVCTSWVCEKTVLNGLYINSYHIECGKYRVGNFTTCYSLKFNKCSECETGYILNIHKDQCQQCTVSNCRVKGYYPNTDKTECTECESGYYLNTDNTGCDDCVANCNTCGSQTTYTTFNIGYHPSIDKTECIDCPDNCVKCHKDNSDNIICDMCDYETRGFLIIEEITHLTMMQLHLLVI
ncbi:hypothetical protein QTN25_004566 [Entamoeba marina]